MLQMRLREGNNRQWFNPARDIANIMPPLVRAALQSFDGFEGTPECSAEELVTTAGEFGLLYKKIISEPVDIEAVKSGIAKIEQDHPVAFSMISKKFLTVLTGLFASWIVDVKPKAEGDDQIPTVGLDSIRDYLLADHEYIACECGSTRFTLTTVPKGILQCDRCGKPAVRVRSDAKRDA